MLSFRTMPEEGTMIRDPHMRVMVVVTDMTSPEASPAITWDVPESFFMESLWGMLSIKREGTC